MFYADYIKSLRLENSYTQSQLAKLLGVTVGAIKKIERGATQYPSTKVLSALAKLENKQEIDILQLIIFGYIEEFYQKKDFEFVNNAQRYLAYMYMNGWSINRIFPIYNLKDYGKMQYVGELIKKRDSSYNILVDTLEKYQIDVEQLNDRNYIISIFVRVMSTLISIDQKFKGVTVLFNANNKKDVEIFNALKTFTTEMVKVSITIVLFDDKEVKVIDEHKMC